MRTPLRLSIATAARFHVLDLARELAALGHDVSFHSYLPRKRVQQFGFPASAHRSMFGHVVPLVLAERYMPHLMPELRERLLCESLDRLVANTLERCDAFIFMSGTYLEAARQARRSFGAKLLLHRGNQHILEQIKILQDLPNAQVPADYIVERELAGYELADHIMIASRHVYDSFAKYGTLKSKLLVNPYGVDLNQFPKSGPRPQQETVTFCMAGLWCRRKGCDLLVEVVRKLDNVRILHVGNIGDLDFPKGERFVHLPRVEQTKLAEVYRQCQAFVLPSREDGFGMVLPQALASGLPVVCTDRTGGPEIRHTKALEDRIVISRAGDRESLRAAMQHVRDRLQIGPAFRPITEEDRETLSWQGYARRYEKNLNRIVSHGRTLVQS